jgi:hypothetical protein
MLASRSGPENQNPSVAHGSKVKQLVKGMTSTVTPYFSERIEFYKFIYLNKYLFIAFHADAYFP